MVALYAFDHALARAEAATSNPLTAGIRLVWWRDSVAEIAAGEPVRRHPTAEALACVMRAHDLPAEALEAIVEARIGVLDHLALDPDEALTWARNAEGRLAALAARVLGAGAAASSAEAAGTVWGLLMLRRSGRARGAAFDVRILEAMDEARQAARRLPTAAFPAALAATLVRVDLSGRQASVFEKRFRLIWASLTGSL